jgi:4-hydroxyphenylpyruvate dioxygenase
MSSLVEQTPAIHPSKELGIKGVDHLEFFVGNPRQATDFYRANFGLVPLGYAGLETGVRDRSSYVIANMDLRFVLTGPIAPEGSISNHVLLHGDSIRNIALSVDDAESAFHRALSRGAAGVESPSVYEDENGRVVSATISAFGDIIHTFVERQSTKWFLPGFRPICTRHTGTVPSLATLDHLAISVSPGKLDETVSFYENVLGFHVTHREFVETPKSSMNSAVVASGNGLVRLPLVEPVPGKGKSQIDEYLDFNRGPGVQHAALHTDNIVNTVLQLQERGIEFLKAPRSYYEMLGDRVGFLDEDLEALRDLSILVDRDQYGYLMQIFSKPLQGRPTFFFEIIQRKGASGFGSGNIRALFEAVEREQAVRGNL